MFTFGKNTPEKPTFSKNTLILDYLVRMEKDLGSYRAMCIFIHKLQSQKMRTMQRQELIETFENVIKKSGGEIFGLPNDDMVIIFNNKAHDEILACLVKVRFMFHDDPLIQNAFDLENAGFVKFFELGNGATEFKSLIKANMENSDEPGHVRMQRKRARAGAFVYGRSTQTAPRIDAGHAGQSSESFVNDRFFQPYPPAIGLRGYRQIAAADVV